VPTSSPNPERDAYIAGLHKLADWLERNPDAPISNDERLLIPLTTNAAVEEFAARHGLTVEVDKDGNAFTVVPFGPFNYHAYGYADWESWRERHEEKTARSWADSKGLTIQPREGGDES
jgi:hypothetical protein